MSTAHTNATTAASDDPLSYAIAQELQNQDLHATIKRLEARAKAAERQARQAEKHQQEAEQQRERAERLRGKLEVATKDAKQARHQARQAQQQAEAKVARAERDREEKTGPHATLKSDDEKIIVQLAYGQVHIHEPDRWYMVSSQPLAKADKHRLVFCGLIDGIKAGDYADFAVGAAQTLAAKWRRDNNCLRLEDLDLAGHIVNRLEEAGYELASEIAHRYAPDELLKIKGIGPATMKKLAKALRKEGLA